MTATLLAQDAPTPTPPHEKASPGEIFVAAAVLLAVALAGGFVWLWMRRRLFAPDDAGAGPGTIMEDLRRMHAEGKISQEEYDSIRRNMATRLARSGFGEAKPTGGPKPPKDGR